MQSEGNTFSVTWPAAPDSVARARHAVADFANRAGADSRQVDAVRLATSEAVTNVVLHAYREDPGSVHITAAVTAGELWVLVCDDGCGLEPMADRPGLGLGLALISQVSDELVVMPRANGGIEVRMRFSLVRTPRAGGGAGHADAYPARAIEARQPHSESEPWRTWRPRGRNGRPA